MNKNRLLKVSVVFTLFLIFSLSNAQICIKDIEAEKVIYKPVLKYLHQQEKQNIKCMEDMVVSCGINTNTEDYYHQKKTYLLAKNSTESFNDYLTMNPFEVYNSKKIKLGLLLCRNGNSKIKYAGEEKANFEKGQIMYLKLGFLKGLYKMAVAFEILEIDSTNKSIVLSYLHGGKSAGKQILTFSENENGKAIVKHDSYYKSGKYLRDKLLYPYFHSKVTNDFHRKAKLLSIKQNTQNK